MAGPLGASPGIIIGVGVGEAAAAALEPIVEPAKQDAWQKNQNAILDAGVLARLAAQGGITLDAAKVTAELHGLSADKMDRLYYLAQTVPGVSEALTLYRRQQMIGNDYAALLDHALVKSGVDPRYVPAIKMLVQNILSPSEVANAIQQGHITDQGILPGITGAVTPPGGVGTVTAPDGAPPFSVDPTIIALDGIAEAAGAGIDEDRLKVLANLVGLPPASHELLTLWNRGLVDEDSVNIGLREGHVKTKWTTPVKRLRWAVLSPLQYVEARVRGWITNDQLYSGGALSGYTKAQLDLLHSTHGRPLSFRQVWVGLQRGGKRLDPVADFTGANPVAADGSAVDPINETFFKALQQSNIQQQWYSLAWAQRYSKFSPFFVFRAVGKGADPAWAKKSLMDSGYDPADIDIVMPIFAPAAAGPGAAVKKETLTLLSQEYLAKVLSEAAFTAALQGMGYTAQQAADVIQNVNFKATSSVRTRNTRLAEKQYVAIKTSEAQARQQLAALGWPQGVIDNYIAAWNIERDIQVTTLTVAQIAAALKSGALLASVARPLLADLGENPAAIETIIATAGADPLL